MPTNATALKKKSDVVRNRLYARLCEKCKQGIPLGYTPTRAVVSGHAVWLHDGLLTCMAWEQREKDWLKDHPQK